MISHRHVKNVTAMGESSIGPACASRYIYIPDVSASSSTKTGGLERKRTACALLDGGGIGGQHTVLKTQWPWKHGRTNRVSGARGAQCCAAANYVRGADWKLSQQRADPCVSRRCRRRERAYMFPVHRSLTYKRHSKQTMTETQAHSIER